MSEDEKPEEKKNGNDSSTPDGVNLPPIGPSSLPKPDDFDLRKSSKEAADARKRAKAEQKARKKKKKGKRSHPTDAYAPLKKSGGGKGCFGCIFLALVAVVLVIGGLVGYFFWFSIYVYKNAGYEVVQMDDMGETASFIEEPEVESVLAHPQIEYLAETTTRPIVFVGRDVVLSGTFEEKVTFKGWKVTLEEGTVFKKDFEVYGLEMVDKGAVIEGELSGSVLQQD